MSELERLGITVQRSFETHSTEVNGISLGGNEITQLAFTLPKPSTIHATFSREGLGKKLVKLFKKELQTGDAPFDALVYVSTDTPDETGKLLASPELRAIIGRVVQTGGAIEIDDVFVKLALPGHIESDDDPDLIAVVRALL